MAKEKKTTDAKATDSAKTTVAAKKLASTKKIATAKVATVKKAANIKFNIRPLEAANLFTIRHINSAVKAYCKSGTEPGQGKIYIEIDIESGFAHSSKSKGDIEEIELPIFYNENIVKFNQKEAAELIIKFVIPQGNIVYSNTNNLPDGKNMPNSYEFSRNALLQGKVGGDPSVYLLGGKVGGDPDIDFS